MRNPDAIPAALFANRPAPPPRSADRVSLLCGLLDAYERELSGRLDRYLQIARRARERALDGHDLDGYAWDMHLNVICGRKLRGMRFRGLRGAELEQAVRYLDTV